MHTTRTALLAAAAALVAGGALAQQPMGQNTQPAPSMNQSQVQANQAQKPKQQGTAQPTNAAQDKPTPLPETAR